MDLNATRMFVWLARQMMGRGLTEKIIQVGLQLSFQRRPGTSDVETRTRSARCVDPDP